MRNIYLLGQLKSCLWVTAWAFVSFWSLELHAQNLVLNPSFEVYTVCPLGPGIDSLNYVTTVNPGPTNWSNPTVATSDYFNVCSTLPFPLPGITPPVAVPTNAIGSQQPHTGNAYCGFFAFEGFSASSDDGWREYMQGRFSSPLVVGQQYCVSFWVSLGDGCSSGVNGLQAYLSTTIVRDSISTALPFTPQVLSPLIVTDRVNWVKVSQTITATAAYQFITIGNFRPTGTCTIQAATGPTTPSTGGLPISAAALGGYYYLDDVSVTAVGSPPPPPTVSNDTTICANQPITLRVFAPAGSTYTWSNGATTSSINVSPAVSTNYSVIVDNGCFTYFDTIRVTVNTCNVIQVSLAASSTTLCPGGCTTLTPTVLGAQGAVTYSWTPSTLTGGSAQSLCNLSGNTSVQLIVTDAANGNRDTATVQLTLSPKPTVNLGPDVPLCIPNIVLDATTPLANTYRWYNAIGSTLVGSTAQLSLTPSQEGTYFVVVTTAAGCSDTDSITISTCTQFTASISADKLILCSNECATLTASQVAATGAVSYQWLQTGLPFTNPSILCNLTADTTFFIVGIDAASGNRDTASVTIQVVPAPIAFAGADTSLCRPDSMTLVGRDLSGQTGLVYAWYDNRFFAPVLNTSAVYRSYVSQTKTYFLTLITPAGCRDTDSVRVTVSALNASFVAQPDSGYAPLLVLFNNNSTGANAYLWSFGDSLNTTSTQAQPNFRFTRPGLYTVRLIGRNGACADTATARITVREFSESLYIPNVFTPNGDNINDRFNYIATGFERICTRIYNRWGQEVWSNDCNQTTFWDGTQNGRPAPEGAYVFQLSLTMAVSGRRLERTGTVTLIR
jgi:gliding motility-associated-like protein